jgi:transcription elongation GreA/GreB family factor
VKKADVVTAIIEALTAARDLAAAAADQAKETATSKENIAENKYDTLGLEAAYLAHGQSTRVQQLTSEIAAFTSLKDLPPAAAASAGSLVALEGHGGDLRWLFIGRGAAGLKIRVAGAEIVVVTPESPAGQALLELAEGDVVSLGGTEYALHSLF